MNSSTTPRFWRHYHALPPEIQRLADKNFKLFKANPRHPSLRRLDNFQERLLTAEWPAGFDLGTDVQALCRQLLHRGIALWHGSLTTT
jgi:hypothetical protein